MLAELHGGQEQVGESKNGFFQRAVGEMVIGAPVEAHLGLCLTGVREWGQGWLCPLHLHPKALGRAAASAGNWDSPCNAQTAPAASLQQQNPQSSWEREESQSQESPPVCPQNILEQDKGRM